MPQSDQRNGGLQEVPRLPLLLLRACLPYSERDEVIAELAAEFTARQSREGRRVARAWLWRQVLGSVPPLARRTFSRGWTGFEPASSRLRPGGPLMESLIIDLRYAARRLRTASHLYLAGGAHAGDGRGRDGGGVRAGARPADDAPALCRRGAAGAVLEPGGLVRAGVPLPVARLVRLQRSGGVHGEGPAAAARRGLDARAGRGRQHDRGALRRARRAPSARPRLRVQ